jgi:hypothetical protein
VKFFLRVFADCESHEAAQALAARMLLALSSFSPIAAAAPKQYWKMPHLFEFTFTLFPATEASFQAVVSSFSGGWHHLESQGSEHSSVWNRKNDHAFLVPEVSWADLQLHETAA